MIIFKDEITTLVGKLPAGRNPAEHEPIYDLMSDAFVWRDELLDPQDLSQGEAGAMRALWRYRTSIITGIPDERFKALWEYLADLSPDWVGFAKARTNYSKELADRYRSLKHQAPSRLRP